MKVAITFPSDPSIKQPMVLDKIIGQGKFKVWLAKHTETDSKYALKVFSRDFSLRQFYSRETSYISKLDHPNIIKYFPILSHNFRLDIMLTEYSPNGDLFDFITKGFLMDDKMIRSYFHQLVNGIEYMHNLGIAHLDLKLENLLLDENFVLKIIDFDQSQSITDEKLFSLGTTGYRAPEVRKGTCTEFLPVDIYSAGVILFCSKAQVYPFEESSDRKVKEVKFYDTFVENNEEFWKEKEESSPFGLKFDNDFKELINGMLKENASERMNIEDIKKSKWYNGPIYTTEELKEKVAERLSTMNNEEPQQVPQQI